MSSSRRSPPFPEIAGLPGAARRGECARTRPEGVVSRDRGRDLSPSRLSRLPRADPAERAEARRSESISDASGYRGKWRVLSRPAPFPPGRGQGAGAGSTTTARLGSRRGLSFAVFRVTDPRIDGSGFGLAFDHFIQKWSAHPARPSPVLVLAYVGSPGRTAPISEFSNCCATIERFGRFRDTRRPVGLSLAAFRAVGKWLAGATFPALRILAPPWSLS